MKRIMKYIGAGAAVLSVAFGCLSLKSKPKLSPQAPQATSNALVSKEEYLEPYRTAKSQLEARQPEIVREILLSRLEKRESNIKYTLEEEILELYNPFKANVGGLDKAKLIILGDFHNSATLFKSKLVDKLMSEEDVVLVEQSIGSFSIDLNKYNELDKFSKFEKQELKTIEDVIEGIEDTTNSIICTGKYLGLVRTLKHTEVGCLVLNKKGRIESIDAPEEIRYKSLSMFVRLATLNQSLKRINREESLAPFQIWMIYRDMGLAKEGEPLDNILSQSITEICSSMEEYHSERQTEIVKNVIYQVKRPNNNRCLLLIGGNHMNGSILPDMLSALERERIPYVAFQQDKETGLKYSDSTSPETGSGIQEKSLEQAVQDHLLNLAQEYVRKRVKKGAPPYNGKFDRHALGYD